MASESIHDSSCNRKTEFRFDPHVLTGRIDLKENVSPLGGHDEIEGSVEQTELFHENMKLGFNIVGKLERCIGFERSVAPIDSRFLARLGVDFRTEDAATDHGNPQLECLRNE